MVQFLGPKNGLGFRPSVLNFNLTRVHFPGPKNGPRNSSADRHSIPFQVVTGWCWWNRLEADTAARGKQPLRVNIDEANISRSYHNKKGLVLSRRCPTKPMFLLGDAVTRGSFSHGTLLCDSLETQPLLPQLMIGNSRVPRKQDFELLRPSLPANV